MIRAYLKKLGLVTKSGLAVFFIFFTLPSFAWHGDYRHAPIVEKSIYPKIDYGKGKEAQQVRAGEYLVKIGNCVACHTKKGGKPFAGGLAIDTPFGKFYSTNITPDKKTGIGRWSNKDFIRSMKQGIRPDGSYHFPVYPYLYFNRASREDLIAIRAYLKRIPAVSQVNTKPGAPWPFSWRFAQFFWRILFFHPYKGEFRPNPKQLTLLNDGAYFVESFGHCQMCHTPVNFLGGPEHSKAYKGGVIQGNYAPDISGDNLKDVPIEEIINVFTHNQMIGGHNPITGPMLEVNHNSLRYLSRRDLKAIALYLKSTGSHKNSSKSNLKAKQSSPLSLAEGREVYNNHCAVCHQPGLQGAPKVNNEMVWRLRLNQGIGLLYQHAILGVRAMPAKGTCMTCTPNEVKGAVDYMLARSGANRGFKKPKRLTQEDGKRIYKKACAVCHDKQHLNAPVLGDSSTWDKLIQKNVDVLVKNSIKGYKGMPKKGACYDCSDAEVAEAVIYMIQQSTSKGDYQQW